MTAAVSCGVRSWAPPDWRPGAEYIVENDTPDVTPLHTADVGYEYLRRLRY